jgi:hypothetical protein
MRHNAWVLFANGAAMDGCLLILDDRDSSRVSLVRAATPAF